MESDSISLDKFSGSSYCGLLREVSDEDNDDDDRENEVISADAPKLPLLEGLFTQVLMSKQMNEKLEKISNGDTQCDDAKFKWKLTTSSGKDENGSILGYCGNSIKNRPESTIFVEINQRDNIISSLDVCLKGKDCGTDNYEESKLASFNNKDRDQWNEVKFYLKNK